MRPWTMLACGVTLSAIGCAGCDKSQPAPTAPADVPVAPAPTPPAIVSWSLMGKTSFTSIGETTQLTAGGTLDDGTNGDLRADQEGFVPLTVAIQKTDPSEAFGGYYDRPMQRIVRIEAGESIKPPPIAPHDVSFKTVDGQCSPCRMIRVITPAAGVLHLAVYWSAATAPLFLWVDGIRVGVTSQTNGVSGDVQVPAGETIVYVGMTTGTNTYNSGPYVTIDLATTFTPPAGTN